MSAPRDRSAERIAARLKDAGLTIDDLLPLLREAHASAPDRLREVPPRRGTLVAVYGPKGGVGRTTVATNLAVALAQAGRSVALVDLDLQFGNVGVALGLKGVNSVAELLGHPDVTGDLVRDTFLEHSSGVRVLVAPEDLSRVEGLDPAQVRQALEQLRGHFDDVVCDMWSMYEDLTRAVLRVADRIVLVTTPEVPALRSLQRVLRASRGMSDLEGRTLIVLNRADGKAGFRTADVARALERPIAVAIPSDGVAITEAVNRGLSILDPRLRSRAARAYRDLAKLVAAPEPRALPLGDITPAEAV
jgi:pilus assembly protein CpaE